MTEIEQDFGPLPRIPLSTQEVRVTLTERLTPETLRKSAIRIGGNASQVMLSEVDLMAHADAWEAKLEAQAKRGEAVRVCCVCLRETSEISFDFGYGSAHDGGAVCWNCADLFDAVVDNAARERVRKAEE